MGSRFLSPSALLWIGAVSASAFVVTLAVLPLLAGRIPEDYFVNDRRPAWGWEQRHRGIYLLLLTAKNAAGLFFVAAGAAMLFLPGQGVLTMLLGLTFMNFPGKRRLEKAVIRRPSVARAVNWMRLRSRRPPLQIPGR